MFSVTLIMCAILKVTSSHSLYHDHFIESRRQANFGFPSASNANSYGSQTGLHRRHVQDTSYVNLHTAIGHGFYPHIGSGASKAEESYKMGIPLTFYQRYGVLNSRRENNYITTSPFFSPQNKINSPKIEDTYSENFGHISDKESVIEVKKRPITNVGVASRSLKENFEDQAAGVAERQFRNDFSTEPIETESTTTQENIHQTYSTHLPYTTNKVTKVNDLSGDRWIWDDDSVNEVTTRKEAPASTTLEPEVVNRVSFDGGDCPNGMTKVFGMCVNEDK